MPLGRYVASNSGVLLLATVILSGCYEPEEAILGEHTDALSEAEADAGIGAMEEPKIEQDLEMPSTISDEDAASSIEACKGHWISTPVTHSDRYRLSVSDSQYTLSSNDRLIASGTWFASGNVLVSLTLTVEGGAAGESYMILDCSDTVATLIQPDGQEWELQRKGG